MTNAQVEVITSVQLRRRWSSEEKRRIVAAAIEPGAVASEVARPAGMHASQLFRWRQQLCGPARETPGFSPVAVVPDAASSSMIEVEFANGARMRIAGSRRWPGTWDGDDPGPQWRAGLAGHGPYRHAQGF